MNAKTALKQPAGSHTMSSLTLHGISGDRLIRLPEVLRIIPISKSKMYEEIKLGRFPAPKKIGARISVWRYSVICDLSLKIAI